MRCCDDVATGSDHGPNESGWQLAEEFSIFRGNASWRLGEAVARTLRVPIGAATVERFPDGEVSVEIHESVRRKDVFVIQSTAPPVNDHLFELLAFADASRRASAAHIVAVIPYFGYARSDKRHGRREPISARLVADLLEAVGIDHVITLDLHASQIEGFFHIPVDSLTAVGVLSDVVGRRLPPETVVVSPDAGRLRMATEYAQRLNTSLILLHKTRETGTETRVTHLVGDVRGRPCLIVDDMISTGGTIAESVEELLRAGAQPPIFVAATHGLLLKGVQDKLAREAMADIFVTDTIQHSFEDWPRVHIVSVAPLIAEAIQRVTSDRLVGGRA
jgi:ribose-phosphate pyrophosphokinase